MKKRSFLEIFLLTIMLTIVNEGSSLMIVYEGLLSTIVNERSSLMIVNEGLLLTTVNETTNFIRTVVFGKKLHATWMSSYMKFKSCGGVKTPWYFLKIYSMISIDALQVGFLSLLTIVNEGVVLNDRYRRFLVNDR